MFLPLVAAALIATASSAEATFQLRYSTTGIGGPFTTVTDNGAGDLDTVTPNKIVVNIGGVSIGATSTSSISPTLTTLDLAVSGITGASTNIAVQASIDGITTAPPPQVLTYKYTSSTLPVGATEQMRTFIDKNNVLFGSGNLAADTGVLSIPQNNTLGFSAGTPYSMTAQVTMSGSGTFSLSLDNNNAITPSAVPAPAGLVLALVAMPFLAVGVWLRRRPGIQVA